MSFGDRRLFRFEWIRDANYVWKLACSSAETVDSLNRLFERYDETTHRTVNKYCMPFIGSSLKSSGRFATGRICLPYDGSSSSESSNSSCFRFDSSILGVEENHWSHFSTLF